jgi:hypothetical protein
MAVGKITLVHKFDEHNLSERSLITAVHTLDQSTLMFGSYPSGIHLVDFRHPRGIVHSGQLPKAPSAAQATPLCIASQSHRRDEFLVCGRFPSVLLYDIRKGFGAFRSVYSGATSLSCLTMGSCNRVIAGGSYKGTKLTSVSANSRPGNH